MHKTSSRFTFPLITAAILTVGVAGFGSWSLASSSRESATDPHSPLGVAETLDSIVQPRFFRFDDDRFGMSRIAVPQKSHPLDRFTPETDREKERFASLTESKRDYIVLFYRTTMPPANSRPFLRSKAAEFRYVIGTQDQHLNFNQFKPEWYPMVQKQLSHLNRGIPVTRETGDWLIAMRPVKNNEQCVTCHTDSKPDEMLGIMVYAVRRTIPKDRQTAPPLGPSVIRL